MTETDRRQPHRNRVLRQRAMDEAVWVPVLSVAIFLVLYATVLSGGLISERYLPSLGSIYDSIADIVSSQRFWSSVLATLKVAMRGFVIAAIIGIIGGIVAGRSLVAFSSLRITVEFLRPIPALALIPLVIAAWGPTENSRVFLVTYTVVWPLYLQTVAGVHDTDPVALDTARSFGLGQFSILRRVVLPSASAYIGTAVRIYIVVAVLVAVSSEVVVGGNVGVGGMLTGFAQVGNYPAVYAMVFLIAVQSMILVALVVAVERRALFWHETFRSDRGAP